MSGATEYVRRNHDLWDRRARPHAKSKFYDLAGFRSGGISLTHIERDALGDVRGRSLLHLQCHFGQDTLSWARLGAQVTGIDFSESAIEIATQLSREIAVPARFVVSDVYDSPGVVSGRFDIVFTSYGVLKWLPEIDRWGQVVSHFLRPGGVFFMVEFHPILYVMDYERAEELKHPYFQGTNPRCYDEIGSYADPHAHGVEKAFVWSHPVSRVVSALVRAGLNIVDLTEYPYSAIDCFPFVVRSGPERYVHATRPDMLPMMYSVRAQKAEDHR
jgi:SAM-dependent methyltransferase